jgi:serine O-acetyltransferase
MTQPERTAHSSRVGALLVRVLRWNLPVVAKLFRVLLGSDIYGKIPDSLVLPHPYGITVHVATTLGRNVVLLQHVTIGCYHDDRWGQAPTIEDDVFVGAGAVILGPITVGRGAQIGANAVVTKDVPPGRTVVGSNHLIEPKLREKVAL